MDKALELFLDEKKLFFVERVGKGHSSQIFLVKDKNGKKFVAKVERLDSTRFKMAERESEHLKKANSLGIGPKLKLVDLEKRIVLMEFIDGKTFSEWLFLKPGKKVLEGFVKELFEQATALDKAGLDHGQLAGKGKNILVRNNKPVIIDWEKGSELRKCHNRAVIEGFLFKNPNSAFARIVKEILYGYKSGKAKHK